MKKGTSLMFKIFSIYMDYYIFIRCCGGEMFGKHPANFLSTHISLDAATDRSVVSTRRPCRTITTALSVSTRLHAHQRKLSAALAVRANFELRSTLTRLLPGSWR
jgi:hypothetical protein